MASSSKQFSALPVPVVVTGTNKKKKKRNFAFSKFYKA